MSPIFELYWPKETGCDAGARVSVHQLEAAGLDATARQRLLALVKDTDSVLELHLPFLDRRECRRRGEVLRAVHFVRGGNMIRGVPSSKAATLRDVAARTLLAHSAWSGVPSEREPRYFRAWQSVSVALQRALRIWIPEICFRDPLMFEDRATSYPVLIYAASRPCYGHPRTEFTYDLADPLTMDRALRMSGQSLHVALAGIEACLHAAGHPALARRYAPIWHEDIMRAVRERPSPLIDLLAKEASLVNAVIHLGTSGRQGTLGKSAAGVSMLGVKPFARAANGALRRVAGHDMRALSNRILETATRALEQANCRHGPAPRASAQNGKTSTHGVKESAPLFYGHSFYGHGFEANDGQRSSGALTARDQR